MRVLVTGAGGLLGAAIAREFKRTADVHAALHRELDVADEAAVETLVASSRPDVIINCAAYNDVDGAQDKPGAALRANAFGVLTLARAAERTGATLVHYSTDFVFDGDTSRPYSEEDAPNPRNVYGASKLLGDWFARNATRAYVLRVESLFGEPGPAGARRGSLATIVDRIRAGLEVPVFVDRTVSPAYTADVARATRAAIERKAPAGVYHCVNEGAATWAHIAQETARLLECPLRMAPLTLERAALIAPRPRYCALSPAKLRSAGIAMPPWQDALARYLRGSGTPLGVS
jgi:dTDP-4-dehydrorhamnose reductase